MPLNTSATPRKRRRAVALVGASSPGATAESAITASPATAEPETAASPATEPAATTGSAPTEPAIAMESRRQQLVEELTVELTSWSPREFIFAFRRMHQGALSLIHLNVLTQLEVEGPVAMGRLAELLDVSVASATGIVTRMETRGLIERGRDDHDRRIVLVRPTEAAADVFRGIDEHRRAGLTRLLTHLTDDELAGFLAGHRALRAARARYIREVELAAVPTVGPRPREQAAP